MSYFWEGWGVSFVMVLEGVENVCKAGWWGDTAPHNDPHRGGKRPPEQVKDL